MFKREMLHDVNSHVYQKIDEDVVIDGNKVVDFAAVLGGHARVDEASQVDNRRAQSAVLKI
jgi:hypothetical protein